MDDDPASLEAYARSCHLAWEYNTHRTVYVDPPPPLPEGANRAERRRHARLMRKAARVVPVPPPVWPDRDDADLRHSIIAASYTRAG